MPTRRIRMALEALLIGLAVVAVLMAVVPAGRRLIATALDVVDGSVAMYAIRSTLGFDTTTARQRRIDRRHAREQAEILRRIGGLEAGAEAPSVAVATTPARLVVSGDTGTSADATETPPSPASTRRLFLRDGLIVTVGFAVVLVAVTAVVDQPSGGVLGDTSAPQDPANPAIVRAGASAVATTAPGAAVTSTSPTEPAEGPATGSPSDPVTALAPPTVTDLTARLTGSTGGGRTVAVRLAWDLAPDSPPASGFDIFVQVDDREASRVRSVDGDTRSLRVTLGTGRTSDFRIVATGAGGDAAAPVSWAPIEPGRHQETSSLATRRGTWRAAEGPSLSGGGVTFSRTAGSTITFRFRGTEVGWIATRTPMSGRAQVRIDGDLVATVDLASGTVDYRQLVFRHHLDGDAPHVLEIRALGDGRVDVDAFVVLR